MKTKDAMAVALLTGKPLPLPVIDIHGHLGPLNTFYIPNPEADGMVEVMDRTGVAAIAVSSHYAISSDFRYGNDYVAAAIKKYPGRFIGYATVDPHYPDGSVDELKRCFDELGFRMIKLHPGIHHYKLTDKGYDGIYRFAEERGAPLLMHTWEDVATCSPDVAAEAAQRHPGSPFIMGHAGAPLFDKALEHAARLPNVYVDLTCSRVFEGTLEHFLSIAPVEKILFGSDCPFLSLPQHLAKVAYAAVSEDVKRKVFRDNAAALLRKAGLNVPQGPFRS